MSMNCIYGSHQLSLFIFKKYLINKFQAEGGLQFKNCELDTPLINLNLLTD